MLVLAGPALAFLLARVICRALASRRHDEERHGRETGRIVMNPQGGYTEIRAPAHRAARQGIDSRVIAGRGRGHVRDERLHAVIDEGQQLLADRACRRQVDILRQLRDRQPIVV